MSSLDILKDKTILVVEDDEEARNSMKGILGFLFKDVYFAENGDAGIKSFQQNNPDIIMTDMVMPVMDGIAMMKEVRSQGGEAPFILISAYEAESFDSYKDSLGIGVFLRKPFTLESLESALVEAGDMIV